MIGVCICSGTNVAKNFKNCSLLQIKMLLNAIKIINKNKYIKKWHIREFPIFAENLMNAQGRTAANYPE
jgi:hypothetical protein